MTLCVLALEKVSQVIVPLRSITCEPRSHDFNPCVTFELRLSGVPGTAAALAPAISTHLTCSAVGLLSTSRQHNHGHHWLLALPVGVVADHEVFASQEFGKVYLFVGALDDFQILALARQVLGTALVLAPTTHPLSLNYF